MSEPQADSFAPLLLSIAGGDKGAFRRLYQEAGPKLLGIARRVLRRPELAEEALQEGFIKIWRNAARFDPARGTSFAWMATIVRRVALDRIPPDRGDLPLDEDIAAAAPGGADTAMTSPKLGRCLKALQEVQREALVLAFVYGMSHSEVAARMKAPLGTAKSWVRRGLQQLKTCLGGDSVS